MSLWIELIINYWFNIYRQVQCLQGIFTHPFVMQSGLTYKLGMQKFVINLII